MRYVSTRGQAPVLGFGEAMLTGLARDGGLYVPESVPTLTPAEIAALAALPYEPCKLLTEYLTVQKRLGQLAEGNQAWL